MNLKELRRGKPGERTHREIVVAAAANVGYYASTAIAQTGAAPQYVEVDEDSLTLAPAALAQALRGADKPAAVIATHLYGRMADMPALAALCSQARVPLVEDVAQVFSSVGRFSLLA